MHVEVQRQGRRTDLEVEHPVEPAVLLARVVGVCVLVFAQVTRQPDQQHPSEFALTVVDFLRTPHPTSLARPATSCQGGPCQAGARGPPERLSIWQYCAGYDRGGILVV
jgi:hypothetical protein